MPIEDELYETLIETFREEAAEIYDRLATHVETLGRSDIEDRGHLMEEVLRLLHTMKGSSAIAGFEEINLLSHRTEDAFVPRKLDPEPLPAALVELCQETFSVSLQLIEGRDLPGEAERLVDLLGAFVESGATRAPASEPGHREPDSSIPATAADEPPAPASEVIPPFPESAVPGGLEDSGTTSIRVESTRLDHLMAQAGELLISEARLARRVSQLRDFQDAFGHLMDRLPSDAESSKIQLAEELEEIVQAEERQHRSFSLLTEEIGSAMKKLRMLPLASQGAFWRRTIRDAAREARHKVRLELQVGDLEMDKQILDDLKEPFLHLLRNAADHGIEPPEEREAHGKDPTGTVRISAAMAGAMIRLSIEDDGRGIEPDQIAASALKRGVVSEERLATMSDEEKMALLFRSGFSTREHVTRLSGRGVGLDVVARRLKDLGGQVRLRRGIGGIGTGFDLVLPLSLLSLRGLLVRSCSTTCALPIDSIDRSFRRSRDEVTRLGAQPAFEIPGEDPLPLRYLASFLQEESTEHPELLTVVVLDWGDGLRVGLVVDELLGEHEFVTHSLPWNLPDVPGVAGAFLLPDGSVGTVLDPNFLCQSKRGTEEPTRIAIEATAAPRILIVDDSLTSRTLQRSILQRAGYEVLVAEDGLQAWNLLQEEAIDLVISDVEMPTMNGLELTRRLRRESRFGSLPIILVTSLGDEEQIREGGRAGADEYIVKGQFEQNVLLQAIGRHL